MAGTNHQKLLERMEENNIREELKSVLKNEGLSWEAISKKTGGNRANVRRNLLGWLDKANAVLDLIGYQIMIKNRYALLLNHYNVSKQNG